MVVKVVAIIVACSVDLIACQTIPFVPEKHIFDDPDICHEEIKKIVEEEMNYRKRLGDPIFVVMGKCQLWLDE